MWCPPVNLGAIGGAGCSGVPPQWSGAREDVLALSWVIASLASRPEPRSRLTRDCICTMACTPRGRGARGAASVQLPESMAELKTAVINAASPCRVVGRGHSFSPMAECADGTLLSLARLNNVLDFQAPTKDSIGSITIEGGTTYTEIAAFLGRRGALRNLPSCPQFTVAGAIATGTHGSGVHIPNLA